MMTPQELKNSILQLAIRGKLVEQRSEEGSAEELYREIQREKQALIKAGKIKKEKPLPEITDDEKPFDIPEGWMWVRLNEVAYSSLGKTLNKSTDEGELCPYLCSINVYWDGIKLDTIKEARFTKGDKEKYKLEKGDLLICEGGDAGRCAIWNEDRTMYYQNALHRVRFLGEISVLYFRHIFEFYRGNGVIKAHCKGETIQHLVQTELYSIPFPLPPLAEQKRIVAKIEELLPLIDRYEAAWTKLEEFNRRFPGDMQKSLLQMAIQGKLVEQRSEEGSAEELYREIQKEKQALIKAGKIKKDKPLPEITDDEKPFEIPEGWKWYRIGEVFNIVNGFTPLKSNPEFWEKGEIPWFTIDDVRRQGRFIFSTEKSISRKALSKSTDRIVPPETVLLCCTASVGEYAFTKIALTTNQQFNAFVIKPYFSNYVYPMYVYEYAKTLKDALIQKAGKTTFNYLPVGKLSEMLVPLPPLAEQKRIVAKIEELLPLCEGLK